MAESVLIRPQICQNRADNPERRTMHWVNILSLIDTIMSKSVGHIKVIILSRSVKKKSAILTGTLITICYNFMHHSYE